MKTTILTRLPIFIKGKNGNLCDEECSHLWFDKDNIAHCRLFGRLAVNKSVIFREEMCLDAEDASYHLSLFTDKIK